MKNLLLLAVVIFGSIQAWERFGNQGQPINNQPIYNGPYVAVYGRDSCGFTKNMISNLKASDVSYHYFKVDDQDIANSLHSRMKSAGISTRRYNLPVVDTNGLLRVRPEFKDVLSEYRAGQQQDY